MILSHDALDMSNHGVGRNLGRFLQDVMDRADDLYLSVLGHFGRLQEVENSSESVGSLELLVHSSNFVLPGNSMQVGCIPISTVNFSPDSLYHWFRRQFMLAFRGDSNLGSELQVLKAIGTKTRFAARSFVGGYSGLIQRSLTLV